MCRQNHGVAVDYFAAGVMAYECMFGRVKIIFIFKLFIETLCRQVQIGDSRSHFGEVGPDKEERNSQRLVSGGRRFH